MGLNLNRRMLLRPDLNRRGLMGLMGLLFAEGIGAEAQSLNRRPAVRPGLGEQTPVFDAAPDLEIVAAIQLADDPVIQSGTGAQAQALLDVGRAGTVVALLRGGLRREAEGEKPGAQKGQESGAIRFHIQVFRGSSGGLRASPDDMSRLLGEG